MSFSLVSSVFRRSPQMGLGLRNPIMLSQMQSAGIKSKAKKPKKKYKMKTHSGCKKRFKVNGKGEIRHWHANKAHLNRNKRNANLRGLKGSVLLSGHMVKKIRRALCL